MTFSIIKLSIFTILISFNSSQFFSNKLRISAEENVYLCNGPSSKVYHRSENCKGLNRCSTQILKVSLSTARNKGRKACRIEY